MDKRILTGLTVMMTLLTLSGCSSVSMPSGAYNSPPAPSSYQSTVWQGNASQTWENLQTISSAKLASMSSANDQAKAAWIQLALISKRDSRNTHQLVQDLQAWRERNPSHPGNEIIPDNGVLNQLLSQSSPSQIAILLPQRGTYGSAGQTVRSGLMNAYYANAGKSGKQNVKFYDTTSSAGMSELYQQAIAEGADMVIGPLVKTDVQALSRSGSFHSPTLALNYTDVYFGSLPSNFYEFGLLPEDEITQVAERARRSGVSNAIIIAPQSAWGQRMASSFTSRWKAIGGSVQDSWYYTPKSDFNLEVARLLNVNPEVDKQLSQQGSDKTVLAKQRRQDFDVIILFSQPRDARVIVPLLRYYYASNIPIYATSSVYGGKANPSKDVDLNGVIVCDIPLSIQSGRNLNSGIPTDRLYAVGQDAYVVSQNIPRLQALPNFPIYGSTGALTLSPKGQIHRRIPCAPIRNGII